MTRRVIGIEGQTYIFSPDNEVPLAERIQALVMARVVDEMTVVEIPGQPPTPGSPPRSPITLEVAESGFIPRVAADGLVGLIGVPRPVDTVHLTVKADGYIPYTFSPTHLGDLLLHREPIVIRGRTVFSAGNATIPLSGVTISVTQIWSAFPPAHVSISPTPCNLVSLRPPLSFPRTTAGGELKRRVEGAGAGGEKRLLEWATQGSNHLSVSDGLNLSAGETLLIGTDDPATMEYRTIAPFAGAGSANPTTIPLTYPLAYVHRKDAVVRHATFQIPTPAVDKQCGRDAITDDSCLFLSDTANLSTADTVEITGDGYPAEYHRLALFSVQSDADGYFQLPPLSRVAQMELQAHDSGMHPPPHPTQTTITRKFSPDYSLRENHLDFVFT